MIKFLVVLLLALPSFAVERSDIPDKYKWDTTQLYATDAAWAKKRDEIAGRIPKLGAYQGHLGESATKFYEALSSLLQVDQELSQLSTYANMRSDEDTRAGAAREMKQSAEDLTAKFATATSFYRPEIIAVGAEKVKAFVAAEPKLKPYQPWLDDILRYAPHTLSAPEEKVAAQASLMEPGPGNAYNTLKDSELPWPEVVLSSGGKVRLDPQGYTKYRAVADRADRDRVFKAFFSSLKQFERTFGSTLDAHVKTHVFNKEVHKFGSALDAGLFDADVPSAVYKQLIDDVHKNLPALHRYLKLRRRMMGLDQLRYEDLYASIVKKVDLHYTPEEARDIVLKAVAPLGPDYQKDMKRAFDERWMDIMPTTGKRSGAYSTGAYGVHPYQLENFNGLYESVSTTVHELGHSMHTLLSYQHQPYVTSNYKIFVAEVASTLNENLLLHYMLSQTKDKDTRLFLLGTYVDNLRTTLFRQTLFAEFEWRVHEMSERGEPLTGERLTELYRKLLKGYYGDEGGVCKVDDLYGIEWAYIPHFYFNFYVYQYATSQTASAQLASMIRANPKHADVYLNMLSSGSSKPPLKLLMDAGVDMTTSAPFNAAIQEMNAVLDEMEKLVGSK